MSREAVYVPRGAQEKLQRSPVGTMQSYQRLMARTLSLLAAVKLKKAQVLMSWLARLDAGPK